MKNRSNFNPFLVDSLILEGTSEVKNEWEILIHKVVEAEAEAFSENPSNYSFICLRVSLEALFALVYPDPDSRLFDKINKLNREWPNCWALSGMHQIRVAGNEVAHNTVTNKTRGNLIILLEKYHDILRWYLEDYKRFVEFEVIERFSPENYEALDNKSNQLKDDVDSKALADSPANYNATISVQLTEKQRLLSETLSGKHFVNAPPGTGKTHLLVSRICNASNTFSPEDIVCLTFTNRAAKEMKDRIKSKIGDSDFFIGNIHAFCMHFLLTQTPSNEQKKFRNLSLLDGDFKGVFEKDIFDDIFGKEYMRSMIQEHVESQYILLSGEPFSPEDALFVAGVIERFCATDNYFRDLEGHSLVDEMFDNEVNDERIRNILNAREINEFIKESISKRFGSLTGRTISTDQASVIQRVIISYGGVETLKGVLSKIGSQISITHRLIRECESGPLMKLAKEQWSKSKSMILSLSSVPALKLKCSLSDDDILVLVFVYLDLIKSRKENSRCYDFDDLISYGLIGIAKSKRKYLCIQVDECQDLNVFQWALIDLITTDESSVMVFGDLAQSIYGFMGASSKTISTYTDLFHCHDLDVNYRSSEKIVKFLNDYREKNIPDDYLPSLASKPSSDEMSTLLLSYEDEEEEVVALTRAVQKIVDSNNGVDQDRNVGIFLRSNKDVDFYATHLNESGIKAFRLGQSDIMKHKCVVDFISLLKAYSGRPSRLDWYRIFYRFTKKTSGRLTRKVSFDIVNKLFSLGISPVSCLSYTGDIVSEYAVKKFTSCYENSRIVVFDTETTSADVTEAELLQLAAISIENGIVVSKFNEFIRIDTELESSGKFVEDLKSSSEIHHIDIDTLKSKGRDSHDVFDEFLDFLGGDETMLVAHNAPYDIAVLERNLDRHGKKSQLSAFLKKIHGNVFDTVAISRTLYPTLESYKLESILAEFELEGVNSHDALDDVIATASLVTRIYEDLHQKIPDVDKILEDYLPQFELFNQAVTDLFSMFSSQSINYYGDKREKNKIRISDLLSQWIEYASLQNAWYSNDFFNKLTADIEIKLVPWMERNLSKGDLADIVSGNDIERLSLMSESDLIDLNFDKVVVSTIHRAKGLQFETAIVPKVIDDIYPSFHSARSKDENAIKEDARLLYVALSRPKNKLIVSYHNNYKGHPKKRSRFINEVADNFDFCRLSEATLEKG
tara:strand:- start:949 stop:4515 length:3567 start_codon:yes stop_codon:yes gene_type:complete